MILTLEKHYDDPEVKIIYTLQIKQSNIPPADRLLTLRHSSWLSWTRSEKMTIVHQMKFSALLHIKSKQHYVTLLHDILLAFTPHEPTIFQCFLAPKLYHITVASRFGSYESFLEVRVNHTCCLYEKPVWCRFQRVSRSPKTASNRSEITNISRYLSYVTWGAVIPFLIVQAFVSVGPDVK